MARPYPSRVDARLTQIELQAEEEIAAARASLLPSSEAVDAAQRESERLGAALQKIHDRIGEINSEIGDLRHKALPVWRRRKAEAERNRRLDSLVRERNELRDHVRVVEPLFLSAAAKLERVQVADKMAQIESKETMERTIAAAGAAIEAARRCRQMLRASPTLAYLPVDEVGWR